MNGTRENPGTGRLILSQMGKMAFGLRRDVQKASYYVWFLGAQEARGLRGSRILFPVIPRLIERAREQEPLKVTLQVSHKGLKIIQGSSKHFIPHSAITCSVQTDDIVACVLLLYNPATKCPLHVHAYRCDSETTAQALNQQLQILINRPENQKRFSELETRLGLTLPDGSQISVSSGTTSTSAPQEIPVPAQKPQQLSKQHRSSSRNYESASPPRRFDSSLGSDTGTSTRESECSEEHTPTSPLMPVTPSAKANLYDSLAAELRAKLNGNGPPLLLPPRDYDTVHRSKGNLAAIELRRCRNISIVGGANKNKSAAVVSSRGSSGIGSDLAPSPERQDGQTSSDDEWVIEQQHQEIAASKRRSVPVPEDPAISPVKYNNSKNHVSSSYAPAPYPKDKSSSSPPKRDDSKRYQRSSSREEEHHKSNQRDSIHSRDEEEVKPVLNKIRPIYRDVFDEKKYIGEPDKRFSASSKYIDDVKMTPEEKPRRYTTADMYRDEDATTYRRKSGDRGGNYVERDVVDYRGSDQHYRENLTDKQKYRESLAEKRINQIKYDERNLERSKERYRDEVPPPMESKSHKYRDSSAEKSGYSVNQQKYDEYDKNRYNREKSLDRKKYSNNGKQIEDEEEKVQYRTRKPEEYRNNPYKQPESQPYRESIEKMLKSPVMRYKSIDDSRYIQQNDAEWARGKDERKRFSSIDRYRDDASPQPMPPMQAHESRYHRDEPEKMSRPRKTKHEQSPEIVSKVSPKDRFQDAKEKFQAMERERSRIQQEKAKLARKSSMEPSRRGSIEPAVTRVYSEKSHDGWSSDEEPIQLSSSRFREMQISDRYSASGIERDSSQSRIAPSKSLSNLVKGYRHSYAEPQRNPMPRSSGRVGLAAVNPY